MTIHNQLQFVYLAICSVLWILCLNVEAAISDERLVLLGHNRQCDDSRTIIKALQDANVLAPSMVQQFERTLDEMASSYRYMRIESTKSKAGDFQPYPARRPLSDLSYQNRRDEVIAALDLLLTISQIGSPLARLLDNGTPSSVSQRYLDQLNVDVIDNSQPNDTVLHLASNLPCLSYAPERNIRRYPVAQFPNDFNAQEQWHLAASPGVDAVKAWNCYNGTHPIQFQISRVQIGFLNIIDYYYHLLFISVNFIQYMLLSLLGQEDGPIVAVVDT